MILDAEAALTAATASEASAEAIDPYDVDAQIVKMMNDHDLIPNPTEPDSRSGLRMAVIDTISRSGVDINAALTG